MMVSTTIVKINAGCIVCGSIMNTVCGIQYFDDDFLQVSGFCQRCGINTISKLTQPVVHDHFTAGSQLILSGCEKAENDQHKYNVIDFDKKNLVTTFECELCGKIKIITGVCRELTEKSQ